MEAAPSSPLAPPGPMPGLSFAVQDGGTLKLAATPTLRFGLRIESTGGRPMRSVVLNTQIQIAARRRSYDDHTEGRLVELFGEPDRWSTTLRTLPWLRVTQVIPPFSGSTLVDLAVPCTYDFDVTASKYLDAVRDGEVPLEFLFGGTFFYAADDGRLQTGQIAWDRESEYRLPARVWRETMDHYFPNSAWVRLGRDAFDKLYAHKSRHTLTSWDATIESLLAGEGEG